MAKLNAKNERERASQVPAPELERRISALVGLFKSRTEAASICEMSTDQLARYEKGGTPSFVPLAKLAIAKGVRLEWLATGEGDMYASETAPELGSQVARLDPGMLRAALEVLDRVLADVDATTDTAGRAELVVAIYELLEQGAALDAAQRVVASMLRAASRTTGGSVKQG
jgi:transcriptional regulator with XRE-family HTH domain